MKQSLHIYCAIVTIFIGLPWYISMAAVLKRADHEKECVVLLHGLGRTRRSMNKLENYLQNSGYTTVNLSYPSTSESIESLATVHISQAIARCQEKPVQKIHFVTHSLGGIILRQYLQDNALPVGSRLVMLAPPNKGSEVADFLKDFFIYKWVQGPAGQELGTSPESVPNRLMPIDVQIGIIAGDRSLNPVFSAIIPGPDDGKVAVERTKLEEMTDFLVVSSSHTFIMRNSIVLSQVVHFLKHGRFDHGRKEMAIEQQP